MSKNDPEYLKLLACIVDDSQPQNVRLEALETVIDGLPDSHPYRHQPLWALFDRVLPPHATRLYLRNGRAVSLPVQRPPTSLADVLA